jgi:hypothetical protein
VRKNALDHLKQQRAQAISGVSSPAHTSDNDSRANQINLLVEDIKQLKTGAFRSWHQQPVIKAFLLLLSSASIFTLDLLGGH